MEVEMSGFKHEHYKRHIVEGEDANGEGSEFREYLGVLVGIASKQAQKDVDKYQEKFLFS
jgi:hypothetical protein